MSRTKTKTNRREAVKGAKRSSWSLEEDAKLRHLTAARVRCKEIAIALCRSVSSVMNRRCKLGAKSFSRQLVLRREKIRQLLIADPLLTNAALAIHAECSRETAARHRRALGLRPLSRSQWAIAGRETVRARREPNALVGCEPRILAILDRDGPLSPAEVAKRAGVDYSYCHKRLCSIRAKGKAFAEGRRGRGKGKERGASGTKWCSFNWWLTHNDGLIWLAALKVHRIPRNAHLDIEDIASEVRLTAAKCVRPFRPRGVKFSTYALTAAHHAAILWCLVQNRRGIHVASHRQYESNVVPPVMSFDAVASVEDDDSPFEPPAREQISAPHNDYAFWEKIATALPHPFNLLVVGYYRDGKKYDELARDVLGGKSRGRVEQMMRQAEELLRHSTTLADYAADGGNGSLLIRNSSPPTRSAKAERPPPHGGRSKTRAAAAASDLPP
jgi:DNA-directed RNA polymerase specialized sigma24 family protein